MVLPITVAAVITFTRLPSASSGATGGGRPSVTIPIVAAASITPTLRPSAGSRAAGAGGLVVAVPIGVEAGSTPTRRPSAGSGTARTRRASAMAWTVRVVSTTLTVRPGGCSGGAGASAVRCLRLLCPLRGWTRGRAILTEDLEAVGGKDRRCRRRTEPKGGRR